MFCCQYEKDCKLPYHLVYAQYSPFQRVSRERWILLALLALGMDGLLAWFLAVMTMGRECLSSLFWLKSFPPKTNPIHCFAPHDHDDSLRNDDELVHPCA